VQHIGVIQGRQVVLVVLAVRAEMQTQMVRQVDMDRIRFAN
jgi:hypothetical protein